MRVRAGPSQWYRSIFVLGGPQGLPLVKPLFEQRDALRLALLKEGFFCQFTSPTKRLVANQPPPVFPVDDGTNFWDRPVACGAWNHVPDRLFVVYAATDTPEVRERVRVIMDTFSN